MFSDEELEGFGDNLQKFRTTNFQHQRDLQALLKKQEDLLESYQRLKSDYEEERESREKYKKLARGKEQGKSYVLVLIDGNTYTFSKELIKARAEGGADTATRLYNKLRDTAKSRGVGAYENMLIRIYADLQGLSRELAKQGLVGHDVRALAPFTASLTSTYPLLDFVHAGHGYAGTMSKMKGSFEFHIENAQCKHVFVAGGHSSDYPSFLRGYQDKKERITCLRIGACDAYPSGFAEEYFAGVLFPLHTEEPYPSSPPPNVGGTKQQDAASSRPPCKYFAKGFCQNGTKCLFSHASVSNASINPLWRANLPKSDGDNSSSPLTTTSLASMSTTTTRDIAGQLPTKPVGSMIPINQHSQRLDIRAVVPDTALWSAYKERTKQEKPCNHFHLLGKCKDSGSCAYSHGCLEPRFLAVLRFIVRGQPCARGSNCRRDNCVNGHICQKPGCTGSGTGCRLKPYMHKIDPVATEWVMPETDVIASPSADTGEEESLDSRSVSGALSPDQGVTLNDGWS